jgi:type I restriction enzyme R subunit
MFNGFDFKAYFRVDTAQKLQVLLGAQNCILSDEKLKERYLKEVTLLSKLFAMSIPSPDAEAIKDEVAFFQAVKARINKFTGSGVKSDYEVETAIKQIIDEQLFPAFLKTSFLVRYFLFSECLLHPLIVF